MAESNTLLRRAFLRARTAASASSFSSYLFLNQQFYHASVPASDAVADDRLMENRERQNKWFTLPPFDSTVDPSSLGKNLAGLSLLENDGTTATTAATNTTALKWVLRCCPRLPRSLVQKLFRLRQVRREIFNVADSQFSDRAQERLLKRVAAKDMMNQGDRILLPITVQEFPIKKHECHCSEEEMNFIRGLEIYKDGAIIAINKPPGMPVQGGLGIKRSLDELAGTCLRYDYSEPPRLVHRLDKDSSGILVMGRTQTSTTVLHSLFREKTFGASDDIAGRKRILQKRYLALVIGVPKHAKGLISAPLVEVKVDDGKSERITVTDKATSSKHAVTEYRVIKTSHDYTWLELSPLTGRKHQLRVHCSEVLGTPIVGDYKYGRQAHEEWKPLPYMSSSLDDQLCKGKMLDFCFDFDRGSISEQQPHLHLHCKQMVLPDVSLALQQAPLSSDLDFSESKHLNLVAPLPIHMQRSWYILNSSATEGSSELLLPRCFRMDWTYVHKAWEKWATNNVGNSGRPLKAALLINYDPTGPSRLLSTIAEQEGVKANPIEISQFVTFIKRNRLQNETFLIGPNEYMVTSIHENWFHGRCMNSSKPSGEGVVVMQTAAFLLVALYNGSTGSASAAVAAADQFAAQLGRKNL
ncbi:hypothetical protein Nepgr_004682 [Nepenthes gracilis]|uniref:Pseudouridine synthase RsuA/RluA-like domain-containing protein n=1 Tax=Nepenthes gracilis TaxID=150966 RepID=A0AAD3S1R3_NEPGR|nr:hypothetical protein Nepgr_004682 [Nepenthes gracilis]